MLLRPGIRSEPHWGSSQRFASPDPQAAFGARFAAGKEGEREGRGETGREGGEGGEGKGRRRGRGRGKADRRGAGVLVLGGIVAPAVGHNLLLQRTAVPLALSHGCDNQRIISTCDDSANAYISH